MKKTIAILFCATFLLGCDQQKPDPKIAELETRVKSLESKNEELTKFQDDLTALVDANNASLTNYNSIQDLQISIQQIEIEKLQDSYSNLIDIKYARQPVPNIKGIPIPAYNQIAAAAAREWPDDYGMQLSRINDEVDAYKKLHAVSAK
jgi:hypothetical protein